MNIKNHTYIFIAAFLLVSLASLAQREKISINENWQFSLRDINFNEINKSNKSEWKLINIPHTWNNEDVVDDNPGFHRGVGWYRKQIHIPLDKKNKRTTIYFEGANQEVELFINTVRVGNHMGGYTKFSFDITDYLIFGEKNEFVVKVDNSYNQNIPPLTADFTFFGGIYRDVYLIYTNQTHFSTTYYASDGVFVSTPTVNNDIAKLNIKTHIDSYEKSKKKLLIEHKIIDPQKNVIATVSNKYNIAKSDIQLQSEQKIEIKKPVLWSIANPKLYSVLTRVYDMESKKLLDEVTVFFGLRWFEFNVEKGFSLNGKQVKLIGTNRHQCFDRLGNALPDEIHVRDVKLLKEMGGNFLRVSHYPQDPVVMEMCDKLGIVASVEIPIVNTITQSQAFYENSLRMAREMVLQDYNRPSVLIWAYMNEVLLRIPNKSDSIHTRSYFSSVNELAQAIESQIKIDDPYRNTLIPFHGNLKDYNDAGLTTIPDIIGWNLYQGWYGSTFDKFNVFLDDAHKILSNKPFIITEYGADVDPRLHSFHPTRFDYTAEYANLYHEHYIQAINERNFVNGANIWNLNDFHSEERGFAMPHINSKGITTLNRELKDTYLHYQAMLLEKPVVNIGSRNWNIRGGVADKNNECIQPIKVYSNFQEIELVLNGISLGKKPVSDYIAEFQVPFKNGDNTLVATGVIESKPIQDILKVDFRMIPSILTDKRIAFEDINVMLGSNRYFEDKQNGVIWIPEKEYTPGSWGYIGGNKYVLRTRHGQLPASDVNILGTENDPVFQTMRNGIDAFKLDVPDGDYSVYLYFAELQSENKQRGPLIYNLGNDTLEEPTSQRIFNVSINQDKIIDSLNLAEEFGDYQAVVKKIIISVTDGNGININFEPIKGEPILNAIRVYRNY